MKRRTIESDFEYYDYDCEYDDIRDDSGRRMKERDFKRREKRRAEDDAFAQNLGFKDMTELREHMSTYDGIM